MQSKLSQYIRIESHSDSEGSTSGIATATDNAYQILPASDSPVSSLPFSSSITTATSLIHNGKDLAYKKQTWQIVDNLLFCCCSFIQVYR